MKVLHVPFCYYPDPVGGTEVYVGSLARVQRARGYSITIAAPDEKNRKYCYDGFDVHRFAISEKLDLRGQYGEGDPVAAANFLKILENVRPDILHLHAFTAGVSLRVARAARRDGIPTVFTYHTPTVTCMRGTLLRWGREACDGEMQGSRCTRCMLHGKGVPFAASWALGSMPPAIGALAGSLGLAGGFWTAFRSTELVSLRHSAAKLLLLSEADHIFAVCGWVRDVLIANGVPPGKITLSRQGVPHVVAANARAEGPPPREASPVRLAFLGRLDAVKGVQVLIDAFRTVPEVAATLDIFAMPQNAEARATHARLQKSVAGDPRIRFLPPLAATEVVDRLSSYDALMVPSQWLETGPLVVYEAFAAGIPVVGSALGGIAELVTDGENGILVPAASVPAWAQAITAIVENPELLRKLKAAPKPVRTADDVAADASEVYAKLLGGNRASASHGVASLAGGKRA